MGAEILRKDDYGPCGFRWLTLKRITYKDQTGRLRSWESAERQSRHGAVDGVAIVAIVSAAGQEDQLVLESQFRPSQGSHVIEFPAGLIDAGETAAQAALRELREETGYCGDVLELSPVCYSDPGMSNANMQFAVVRVDAGAPENRDVVPQLEEGEFIEVFLLPLRGLYDALLEKQKAHGWDIDARLLMYADALRRGAALCASANPVHSAPGAPAAPGPSSGLDDGPGAPEREAGSGARSSSTAASNPGSRGAPAAGSGACGAGGETAAAEAEAACAASSGAAAAEAAGPSGNASAADQPGVCKPASAGPGAPPAHAGSAAESSAHAAAGAAATATHRAPAHQEIMTGRGVSVGHSDTGGNAAAAAAASRCEPQGGPDAPAADLASAAGCSAAARCAPVVHGVPPAAALAADSAERPAAPDTAPGAAASALSQVAAPGEGAATAPAARHGAAAAGGGARLPAAALSADSAEGPAALEVVPALGKGWQAQTSVAAVVVSASLPGGLAPGKTVLEDGKTLRPWKWGTLSRLADVGPAQPRALPMGACFAEGFVYGALCAATAAVLSCQLYGGWAARR